MALAGGGLDGGLVGVREAQVLLPKMVEFVHMAGSRGKHSKNKGKSKSRKSNTVDKKSEKCDCNMKLAKSCCGWPDNFKGDDPRICAMATCRSNYTEFEVAELLFTKIEDLYTNAKAELSKLGYNERDSERAILKNGYLEGPTCYLLDNILINTLAYLEGKENSSEEREGFANMDELYDHVVQIMVNATIVRERATTVPDAMWHVLLAKWPTGTYSRNQGIVKVCDPVESSSFEKGFYADSDCGKIPFCERINKLPPSLQDLLKKNVITLAADIRCRFSNISEQDFSNEHDNVMEASEMDPDFLDYIKSSSFQEFLNGLSASGSGNPRIAMVSDLAVTIRNLEEEVKSNKEWAQQKVIFAAKKVSQNLLEMNLLRMEGDANKKEDELKMAERYVTLKLIEIEHDLREKMYEAEVVNERARRLENDNAQIRSEIDASNLSLGISSRDVEDAVKRERKCLKKAVDLDERCMHLQEQCDEDKMRLLKLQQELLQIEKDAMETEMQWRQELQKKEQMLTCLSEEIRMAEIHKSNSRAELSKLRNKLEIDSQVAKDERRRLEDELSNLRLSVEMQDLSLVDNNNNNLVFGIENKAALPSSGDETSKGIDTLVNSLATENGSEMILNGYFSGYGAIYPDEEDEAAFLRSLGWEENEGEEDQGLTEDEIKEFYEKYMPSSRNL